MQHSADYFNEDQVLEGFTLIDLLKMKDPQLNEILQFWHWKQEESLDGIGFRFWGNSNGQTQKQVRDESEPVQQKWLCQEPLKKTTVPWKGKEKARSTSSECWMNHIEPDSRRHHGSIPQSYAASDSGESFDFTEVDMMASSNEITPCPGDDASASVLIPQVGSTSQNTFGP